MFINILVTVIHILHFFYNLFGYIYNFRYFQSQGIENTTKNVLKTKVGGFLVSASLCKMLGSCNTVLTSKKLNRLEKSSPLRSLREEWTQDKPLPPVLQRQTGEFRESCLTRPDTHKQKPH